MAIGSALYRTPSTNDSMAWARSLMHEAPDGSVFLADTYTHARGRQGRSWEVLPGQLMVTLLLKPALLKVIHNDDMSIRLSQLSMALSLGIAQPFKACGATLKWPNDFMLGDKKMGGMLMQLAWEHEKPQGIVVGFGLNINTVFPPDHPLADRAISLAMHTEKPADMRGLYRDILNGLNQWYSLWQQLDFTQIYKSWRQEQGALGKLITVHHKDGSVISGTAQQVMPNGDLLLKDQHGKQLVIAFYQVEDVRYVAAP